MREEIDRLDDEAVEDRETLFLDVSDEVLEAAANGDQPKPSASTSPTYLRSWSLCCAC